MRQAKVLIDNRMAGILSEDDLGYEFHYLPEYLARTEAVPVSLTMPLRSQSYRSAVLFPFFDGLIPEGWLLDVAWRSWKIPLRDRFGLLLACCNDCIGNVSVVPLTSIQQEYE